jgi:isopenicillin N synthase-like dioxygenase
MTTTHIGYENLELLTLSGPEFHRVSTQPPRPATIDEIPTIDISTVNGSEREKWALASEVKAAAQASGFFYIKNHGIPETVISDALDSSKAFFAQSRQDRLKSSATKTEFRNGYHESGSTQINRTESRGEQNLRYSQRY